MKRRDLTGRTFGKLTVVSRSYDSSNRITSYQCRCSCGSVIVVRHGNLQNGHTKSCGCILKDKSTTICLPTNRNHELHCVWRAMLRRCSNPNTKGYKNYGGRGIHVSDEWHTFENFLSDMGERPTRKHTIERKNNDGNYERGNCVWATRKDQANNSRRNHTLTVGKQTRTISQWSDVVGIAPRAILHRIERGWSEEKSVMTPLL